MIKLATVFFLFLTIVYCENVKRQADQDAQNPFMRYRYGEGNDVSNRGWPRRRDTDRRNQRQRAREQELVSRAIVRWLMGDEDYEEVPYWSSYESRGEYPWEAYQFPFNNLNVY